MHPCPHLADKLRDKYYVHFGLHLTILLTSPRYSVTNIIISDRINMSKTSQLYSLQYGFLHQELFDLCSNNGSGQIVSSGGCQCNLPCMQYEWRSYCSAFSHDFMSSQMSNKPRHDINNSNRTTKIIFMIRKRHRISRGQYWSILCVFWIKFNLCQHSADDASLNNALARWGRD